MARRGFRMVHCEGWWQQVVLGRQPMDDLCLSFAAGRVEGSGTDIVGPFLLSGLIADDGTLVMDKQYIGQHTVQYVGTYDGEGTLSGTWQIGRDQGPWLIRLVRSSAEVATSQIVELVPEGELVP
jgi:hypothetical protein